MANKEEPQNKKKKNDIPKINRGAINTDGLYLIKFPVTFNRTIAASNLSLKQQNIMAKITPHTMAMIIIITIEEG